MYEKMEVWWSVVVTQEGFSTKDGDDERSFIVCLSKLATVTS